MHKNISFGLLAISVLLTFCSVGIKAQENRILVFGAASVQNAIDEVIAAFHAEHPETRIVASYASSSVLAKQIENGAPADIYVSANASWMDYLEERDLIEPGSRVDLVGNALVAIAPIDSAPALSLEKGFDLARTLGDGCLAVGDPDHVPAGIYARAALHWMGAWDAVLSSLARAENVRAAMAFVALGECPLGIVYASDAHAETGVRVMARFPSVAHAPIVYPTARVRRPTTNDTGNFYKYLISSVGKRIFEKHGFITYE